MTREDFWRFAGTVIDGHPDAEAVRTVGESATLRVILTAQSDSATGAWPGHVERFRELRQYRPHAGAFASGLDAKFRPWFREQHGRELSLLVALRPPADTQTGQGGWFLVSGCESNTTLPSALCELEFELLYLAALAEYDTADAARNAMEADGL